VLYCLLCIMCTDSEGYRLAVVRPKSNKCSLLGHSVSISPLSARVVSGLFTQPMSDSLV
jgi:hypothetical protein